MVPSTCGSIADRQDLHHGDDRDASLKIDPEVGIVDSAPSEASGCAETFDVLGIDEEGQPPFLDLAGERLHFQCQCGVVAAHHRNVKIANGVACH